MVKPMLDLPVLNNVKWEKAGDPKNMRSIKRAWINLKLII